MSPDQPDRPDPPDRQEPPDFAGARRHVLREVIRLADRLRRAGAVVPANAGLSAVEAVVEVGLDDRERVRAALQATLVQDPAAIPTFEEAFPQFWARFRAGLEAAATADADAAEAQTPRLSDGPDGGLRADLGADAPAPPSTERSEVGDDASDDAHDERTEREPEVRSHRIADGATAGETDGETGDERTGAYSAAGRRTRVADDAPGTSGAVDQGAIRRFERALSTLSGRRWARSRAGDAVDVRRALRESVETGGVAVTLPAREREESAFRVCLLVDVSRSVLDAVDRAYLLSFVAALVEDGRSVRAFFFDTDVREVTEAFADPRQRAGAALADAEVAWGGGTRIGDSLSTLRRRWPHAVDNRTVTVVVSDGLDVGEVDRLEREMADLAGRSRAVVWLNPLAVSPAYEPVCRGMAAALPYVDGLFAFGGDADLREVARQFERHGPAGPVGYEHDFRDRRVES